ncbi:hypothetical protein B0H11DRAFT_2270631 [Mycena galericulata]|nr:hypothetical protein B0H11DRAFT_2270631 [Mycena galericulata]
MSSNPAPNALGERKRKAAPGSAPASSSTAHPEPGSIDPATGFVNVAPAPRSGRGSRRRDFTAQIKAAFPTAAAMNAATKDFETQRPSKRRATERYNTPAPEITVALTPEQADFLRTCIAAVVARHPEFAAIDVQTLVAAGLSVERLTEISKHRIPACGVDFTNPSLWVQFKRAVKLWVENSASRDEIEDCVQMLVAAYPGVVTKDLAPKLQWDDFSVSDLLGFSAKDIGYFGLVVKESVWGTILASIEGWWQERANPK